MVPRLLATGAPFQPTCVVSPGRACMRRSSPACVRDCAGKGATLDGPVVPLGRVLYSSSRSAAEGSEGSEGPGQMIDGASNIVQLTRLVQQLQQKQQEQEHKIVQLSLDVDHLQEETAQRLVLQFVSLVGSRLMAGAAISSVSQKAGMQLALENKRGLVRSAADVLIMLEPGLKLERQTFAAKMDRVYHLCNDAQHVNDDARLDELSSQIHKLNAFQHLKDTHAFELAVVKHYQAMLA